MNRLIRFCVIAATVAGCAQSATKLSGPMPEPDTVKYRACERDDDCERADNGCCTCLEGASVQAAVAKSQVQAFRAQFSCENKPCHEMAGMCSKGSVHCEQNLCTFRQGSEAGAEP